MLDMLNQDSSGLPLLELPAAHRAVGSHGHMRGVAAAQARLQVRRRHPAHGRDLARLQPQRIHWHALRQRHLRGAMTFST